MFRRVERRLVLFSLMLKLQEQSTRAGFQMHEALFSGIDPARQAWWIELHRAPRQFHQDFCEEVGLTWQGLLVMSDIQFERIKGLWSRFRTVPDFRRDERLAVSARIDFITVFHNDGTSWQAPRQRLSDGHFRTPDDPTPAAE